MKRFHTGRLRLAAFLAAGAAFTGAGVMGVVQPDAIAVARPSVAWVPCAQDVTAQCGTLAVPVDWADPAARPSTWPSPAVRPPTPRPASAPWSSARVGRATPA
ncbi:hypothetical protein [Micromonospora sp. KC723]|uniref:hypothetical protein n=1 Tax=Micromonospora sp. KC723 TaxID=2530381 RepID=UPI001A9F2681